MSRFTLAPNALAYAHEQLRGGWKNILATSLAYLLLIAVIMFVTVRLSQPSQVPATFSIWSNLLLVIQSCILVLFGCGTIGRAIRTDISSGMIESHRLMPLSPGSAIFGYLAGATCQVVALALATFLLGLLASLGAQVRPSVWIVPNLILAGFAAFSWCLALVAGFSSPHGNTLLGVLLILLFTSRGVLLAIVPGVALLCSVQIWPTFWSRSIDTLEPIHIISIAAQVVLGALFCAAAARKYRRQDQPALGVWLGMGLLICWVGISCMGIRYWDQLSGSGRFLPEIGWRAQLVSSLAAAMLLALLPVSAAAGADHCYRQRRSLDDPAPMRRPVPPAMVALACTVVVLGLLLACPYDGGRSAVRDAVQLAVTALAFLVASGYMMQMVYRVSRRPSLPMGAFLLLYWIGPLAADLVRHNVADSPDDPILTGLSTLSPLGALIQIWARDPLEIRLGLSVQAIVAALVVGLYYALQIRRRASGPMASG